MHPANQPTFSPSHTERRSRMAALAVATLVHVLVLALLAWIVLQQIEPAAPELEITEVETAPSLPKPLTDPFTNRLRQKPSAPGSPTTMVINCPSPSDVSLISVETVSDSFGTSSGYEFGGVLSGIGDWGGGIGYIPPILKGRCSQADRAKRLRDNGGTPALDRKVLNALDWLKERQNADGSWGESYPVAMTGFALLAFSGHCETVDSPRYGENLIKAINYLVIKSRSDNGLMASKPGAHSPYEHGIATYALAEAYSLNKNARAKYARISSALRNAVPIIIEGQTKGGGWLYSYGQNGTGDLSISGWNVQALKAAELTGLKFSGLDKAKQKALAYLEAAVTPEGLYRYRITDQHPGRLSLTGVGVLCTRMLGKQMPNEAKSLKAILVKPPGAFRSSDPYALYYHSQACFQKGGDTWKQYNRTHQKLVIDSQENDGSWPVAAGHLGAVKADAKIYHTCLCTLMLEVYYRYLPATAGNS